MNKKTIKLKVNIKDREQYIRFATQLETIYPVSIASDLIPDSDGYHVYINLVVAEN